MAIEIPTEVDIVALGTTAQEFEPHESTILDQDRPDFFYGYQEQPEQ